MSHKLQFLPLTMQIKENTLAVSHLAVSHLVVIVLTATITYFALDWRDKSEPIPVDPDTYRIQERMRIDREKIAPLMNELESIRNERDSLLTSKQRIRTIYKDRQNENLNLSDSAAFNLLRERLRSIELP